MRINEQDIIERASSSLARLEADLIGQRDELLRIGSRELATGAAAVDRVIDCARKIREIMSATDQEGDQA
jgi:hypothetical protein